jgi:hypothetical protein
MFKIVVREWGIYIKSFEIIDLWRFMVSNPEFEFEFWKDYTPLTKDEFLKTYLIETKSYRQYLELYRILHKPISIFDYEKKKLCRSI